jgi:hypothetical protein
MVAREVEVGGGDEGGEATEERQRLEAELGAALGVRPGFGEAVADPAVGVAGAAALGEGCAQAISAELLETCAVVGGDGASGVEGEAVGLSAAGLAERLVVGREGVGGAVARDPLGLGEGGVEVRLLVVAGWGQVVGGGAVALEACGEALGEARGEVQDFLVGGWREGDEGEGPVPVVRDEEAVGDDGVDMGIEVQGPAKSLDKRNGAGLAVGDPEVAAAAALEGEEGAEKGTEAGRQERVVDREGEAEGPGEGEDPLPKGDRGENSVDEVSGRIGHASCPADRATARFT